MSANRNPRCVVMLVPLCLVDNVLHAFFTFSDEAETVGRQRQVPNMVAYQDDSDEIILTQLLRSLELSTDLNPVYVGTIRDPLLAAEHERVQLYYVHLNECLGAGEWTADLLVTLGLAPSVRRLIRRARKAFTEAEFRDIPARLGT